MTQIVEDARKLFRDSMEASEHQRQQIDEDLRFSDPSEPDQWDPTQRYLRERSAGGARPCFVFDQCGQYVANVAGQVEKTPPAIHAIPVSSGADQRVAVRIDGRFRHIEHESRAIHHYARILTGAARAGVGYAIVRPHVVDAENNYQEPRIDSESNPLNVVFDPWSTELDGSDADFAFLLRPVSKTSFKVRWPDHDAVDFGETEKPEYNDTRDSVTIVEQFIRNRENRAVVVWTMPDGSTKTGDSREYDADSLAAGVALPVVDRKKQLVETVKYRVMSGADVLDTPKNADGSEADFPSEYIGIIPCYGYVGVSNGRLTYCGIPRRAREPQRAYNYHLSEMLAYISTAPKSPWIVPMRALKGGDGLKEQWDRASVETRAALFYQDLDERGPIEKPMRTPLSVDLSNHERGAAQALRDIQASIGMYQANIGANSNVTSGVAYDAQKQQGEASTAHFPAHLAATVGQIGRVVMQMDIRLADTRREQPIISVNDEPGLVTVDPESDTAFSQQPDGVHINPAKGRYGVRVVVGASYATQRKETSAAFAEMMRANPEMQPAIAPFWAQTLDFPEAPKFAAAMAAMAPPAIKAILKPEGDAGTDVASLAAENGQLKAALAQLQQDAQEAQDLADRAIADLSVEKRNSATKEFEARIKAFEAATNRLQVLPTLIQPVPDVQEPEPEPEAPAQQMEAEMPNQEDEVDRQKLEQIIDMNEQMLNAQTEIQGALETLVMLMKKPRIRTPERDKDGYITRVMDTLQEDDAQPETLQ